MAVGFPVKDDYATGDVLTAANMNDFAGTLNTVPSNNYAAYKNKLINSNFSVWQRGTSFTGTGNFFTADRWQGFRGGATAGATWSQQTASLDGFQYSMRVSRDSGNSALNPLFIVQSFETDVTRQFQGQKITVSFWAKAGANFSAASNNLGINIVTGTGTEASITAGFTAQVSTALTGATLTTSWQRFTATSAAVVPTTASQFALQIGYTPVGTAGAADNFEIAGVQLELGETATGWSLAGATLQGERAACQRYYYRNNNLSGATFGLGQAYSITNALGTIPFPTSMRINPTALEQTGTAANYGLSIANLTFNDCTAVPVFNTANVNGASVVFISTGVIAGNATHLVSKNSAAYLAWSAEL